MSKRTKLGCPILCPDSTNVGMVRYDPESETLEVIFKKAGIALPKNEAEARKLDRYRYYGINPYTFASMVSAGSIGKYFNANIKGTYRRRKLTAR